MAHIITQSCCNDATCVSVCPVNCIHPTPGEPDFATAEMLYIDPDVCIDCGACVAPCPVSAIYPDYELPSAFTDYEELNATYFVNRDNAKPAVPRLVARRAWDDGTELLRVAVVGAGPSAFYAAEELLTQTGLKVEVDMFERLPVAGGLVRYGVAPDHQATKGVLNSFSETMRRPGFRLLANVEVGRDVSHAQLATRYHAVVYAVGAMGDRGLGIPGESLAGCHSATAFVSWYNGHPDFATQEFDLSCPRVAIVGNGNVALDVARILTTDIDHLRKTDISDNALAALAASKVEEVVIIGRRSPAEAAFTTPEFMGLVAAPGVSVVVSPDEVDLNRERSGHAARSSPGQLKAELLARHSRREPGSGRRVTFKFLRTPVEVLGRERVAGIRLGCNDLVSEDRAMVARPTGRTEDLEGGMVLRAVGYRADPLPQLPYDRHNSTLPNDQGRVVDPSTGQPLSGVYATGWIKRGPSGVIGTNKQCAKETVACLLDDFADARLPRPAEEEDVAALLPQAVNAEGARVIDAHERAAGRAGFRPRVKVLQLDEMIRVASTVAPTPGPGRSR
ncbi:FAD-dependent oxidoreductase [Streptomyces sp. NPDC051322]|uniref:FAD-dependent oxidoreductase n=1 Tax=Streptomyces sp. NPDC051322 TaxID=3154645 RepID=UPI00344F05CC